MINQLCGARVLQFAVFFVVLNLTAPRVETRGGGISGFDVFLICAFEFMCMRVEINRVSVFCSWKTFVLKKSKDIFAERFDLKFQQSRMSARALGRILGVSDTSVHNWRRGDGRPVSDKMPLIARTLRTTTSYLLGEIDEEGSQGSVGEEFQVLRDLRNGEHLTYIDASLKQVPVSRLLRHVVTTNEMHPEFHIGATLVGMHVDPGDVEDGAIYIYQYADELPRVARLFWQTRTELRVLFCNPGFEGMMLPIDDDSAVEIYKVRQATMTFQ